MGRGDSGVLPAGRVPRLHVYAAFAAVLFVLACVSMIVTAPAAHADASLVTTHPARAAEVLTAPKQVVIEFDEHVDPSLVNVSVTDVSGHNLATGSAKSTGSSGREVAQPVAHLPNGWYLVSWQAISENGHAIGGAFDFAVSTTAGPPPQYDLPELPSASTPSIAVFSALATIFVLFAFCLALAALTGIGLPRRRRSPAIVVLVVVWVGAIVFPLIASVLVATQLGASWTRFLATEYGRMWSIAALAVFVGGLCFGHAVRVGAIDRARASEGNTKGAARRRVSVRIAELVTALLTAAALVLSVFAGPASDGRIPWLSALSEAVLLLALGAWVIAAAKAARHLVLHMLVACLVAAAGVGFVLASLPAIKTLWSTDFGYLSIALGACLVLALYNAVRRWFRQYFGPEADPPMAPFRLLREPVIAMLLAACCGVAASITSPANALVANPTVVAHVGPSPVSLHHAMSGGYAIDLTIGPNKATSSNNYGVKLTRNGKPVSHATIVAHFQHLEMSMTPIIYTLDEESPGTYTRSAPAFVMSGHWGVTLVITPPGRSEPITVPIEDLVS